MKRLAILVFLFVTSSTAFWGHAFALSPPAGQSSYAYPSSMGLHKDNDPSLCRPVVGQLEGGMLSLLVGLPLFSPGMDIYLAVWSEGLGASNIWMITQGEWLTIGDRLNVDQARPAQDPSLAYSAGDGQIYVAFEETVGGWPQIFVKRTLLT